MTKIALALLLALGLLVVALAMAQTASAGGNCLTGDEAIVLISHKSDVEHGNPPRVKERLWQIADRESGLLHCWANGFVKVSPTADHGLFQLNERGVWRNCSLNPYCGDDSMLDDPGAQVDLVLNYYDRYGDLCPWNPAVDPVNYNPGCGYR